MCARLSPFLGEVDVFFRQDGEDVVEHLVRVGLAGQGHVVLGLGDRWRFRRLTLTLWLCLENQISFLSYLVASKYGLACAP